jgi:DNA polymerase III delta' subunit
MPFREITGHGRQTGLLARSVSRNTLPPSLIFAGPSKVGKRATAVALAQALNCIEPRIPGPGSPGSHDACGRCSPCRRIARGMHPDVLSVEPGDNGSIKIDQVRDVIGRAAYRPFEGRVRVVIVDEADAMVPAAQNALLKTLEEPPASSIFILVTSRPDLLLPTVLSRCVKLWFAAGMDVDAAEGEEARGIAERVLVHAAATDDPAGRMDGAKELLTKIGGGGAGDRERVASYLRAMASLLRDVEVLATHADIGAPVRPDTRAAAERLVRAYQGERGVRAFTAIDQALMALDRNAGVKIVADWVMLQL